ncbi:MAG: dehydrogenase, partial [Verrucomicrobia bacterium]|nr:dehydrogenase [Verrucomicrobiota bacterium]
MKVIRRASEVTALYTTLLASVTNTVCAIDPASVFAIPDTLEIQIFASEPQVVDPVALCFDESNRCYVVEMRDYPLGIGPDRTPSGTIRLLEDTDGDGRVDRSTVFAEGLSYPTSITPYNGGVFVSAPPEILYFKDTDGDRRADVRRTVLRGFTLGVTDSNVNGLRWGLDNRIHGANGGNGGEIFSADRPNTKLSIRDLDFSFSPVDVQIITTFATGGGFGLVFDDWGRRFTTYNINHILHQSVAHRYLKNSRGLPSFDPSSSISDHGEMARI